MTRVRIVRGLRPSVGGGGGSAPAWFAALDDLEVATPLSNWIGHANVKDPDGEDDANGHHGIIDGYCSRAWDAANKRLFAAASGGHSDYGGNEVVGVDFMLDEPAWVRLRNSSSPRPAQSGNHRTFSDGRPGSSHGYSCDVVDGAGRIWKMGLHGLYFEGGGASQALFAFTIATWATSNSNDWTDYGDVLEGNAVTGAQIAFYVPAHDRIFTVYGSNAQPSVQLVRPSDQAITGENQDDLNDGWQFTGAYDTTHDVAFIHGSTGYSWMKYSGVTGGATWQTVSSSGTGPEINEGFGYSPANDCFIAYVPGTGWRKGVVTYNGSGNPTAITWSAINGVSGTAVESFSLNGLQNRIFVFEDMGDGRECVVINPGYHSPKDVFCMALPGGI
jgi:hypothetical protein